MFSMAAISVRKLMTINVAWPKRPTGLTSSGPSSGVAWLKTDVTGLAES